MSRSSIDGKKWRSMRVGTRRRGPSRCENRNTHMTGSVESTESGGVYIGIVIEKHIGGKVDCGSSPSASCIQATHQRIAIPIQQYKRQHVLAPIKYTHNLQRKKSHRKLL